MKSILDIRYEKRTLRWWFSQRDRIEFSPSYQRTASRWTTNAKSFLIDSVLNGFDIPKFYLADFSREAKGLNATRKLFAVIDGKQRLQAFFDFFEDSFALPKSFDFLPDPSLDLSNLKYSDLQRLHPSIAARYDEATIDVVLVSTDDESLINQLFIRLNRSTALSGAEVRNAMSGKVPELTRKIAKHHFFQSRITPRFRSEKFTRNSAAKLLMTEFRGDLYSTTKSDLDRFVVTAIEAELTDISSSASRVTHVLDNMLEVFVDDVGNRTVRALGNIVVYYWLTRNYFHQYPHALRHVIALFVPNDPLDSSFARDAYYTLHDDLEQDQRKFRMALRNVNAAGSLSSRYVILERWLLRLENLYT